MSSVDPTSGDRQPRRRGCLGRALRWGLLALPVLLVAAYLSRDRWLTPIVRQQSARWARESQEATLTIGGLSGSGLGELELTGVEWTSERSALRRVGEGRIRVHFSPWKLLREGVAGLLEVELEAGDVDLGAAPPAEETPSTGEESAASAIESLAVRVDVDRLRWLGETAPPLILEDVRLEAALAGRTLRIDTLVARSGANHLTVTDGVVPLDAAGPEALLRAARGHVALSAPRADELEPPGVPAWPVESADLELDLEDGRAVVSGRCRFVGGSFDLEEGEISLREASSLADARLALALDARVDDLAALGALFGQSLGGRWEGHVDIAGTPIAPVGRFVGLGTDLAIGDLALHSTELDLVTDGQRATLAAATIEGPGVHVEGSGGLAFAPLAFEDLAFEGRVEDPAVLAYVPFPCTSASGSAKLSGPVARPTGSFELGLEGAELGGRTWTEARASGRLEGDEVVLDSAVLAAPELRAEASGWVAGLGGADLSGEIRTLTVQWKEARCTLVEPAQFSSIGDRTVLEQVVLAGDRGRAHVDLALGGPRPHLTVTFDAFEAPALAAVFLPPALQVGPIGGAVEAEMADGAAEARVDLTVSGVRWEQDPAEWRLALKGTLTPTRITVDSLTAHSSTGDVAQAKGAVPFDTDAPAGLGAGPVALEVELEVEDVHSVAERLGLPLLEAHHLEARSKLEGTWDQLLGDATIHLQDVVLPGQASLLGPCALEIRARAAEGSVAVETAEFTFAQGQASAEGTLARPLDVHALRERLDDWLGGALAAELRLDLPDFGGLERLVGIRRASGKVSGTLSLAGTPLAPRTTGSISWRDGELRPTADAPPIRAISADIAFVDGLVRIEQATGELGGAPVRLEGTLDPRKTVPDLDLRVRGQNILLRRTERERLRADADLTLRGPLDAALVSGDLTLTEGRFYGDIRPLDELLKVGRSTGGGSAGPSRVLFWREAPLADARFDVRVRAANAFVVDTNLMEARLRPDCRLSGTGEAPTLSGPVYVEDATILLPSGKMRLQQGVLEFRATSPFRPEIALTFRQDTQGYDVRASVTGTLDEFEIALSSTPPLPSDDLYVLVFTGQPPQDRWQDRSTQAMQSLALFLARDQLVRWLARDPDAAETLLERFEVEVGAKTSISGQPTGRVLFYLRPRSPSSGRATYLSAEIDRYDRVNYALGVVFRPR